MQSTHYNLGQSCVFDVGPDMSFQCPSKRTKVIIKRSDNLLNGSRATFVRNSSQGSAAQPNGSSFLVDPTAFVGDITLDKGSSVNIGFFNGAVLGATGTGVVSVGNGQGYYSGTGSAFLKDPGGGTTFGAVQTRQGSTLNTDVRPEASSGDFDLLTIEVPRDQTGLNSLRIKGQDVQVQIYARIPDQRIAD